MLTLLHHISTVIGKKGQFSIVLALRVFMYVRIELEEIVGLQEATPNLDSMASLQDRKRQDGAEMQKAILERYSETRKR